jgi:hypothetical protein
MELLMLALPATCARHGAAEAAALAARILPGLAREAHIAVRHHPRDGEAIAAALGALPEELSAAVSLTPSEQLASGDLRIAWRDGQATRDTRALLAGIADTLRQHGLLDASPDQPPAPTPPAASRTPEPAWSA